MDIILFIHPPDSHQEEIANDHFFTKSNPMVNVVNILVTIL